MRDAYEILKDYIIKPKGMLIWRDIPGYENLYQISNHGDVRVLKNKILAGFGGHVILTAHDKSRHTLSIKKTLDKLWDKDHQYSGDEIWKPIPSDFFGNSHEISNYGQVKNISKKILFVNRKQYTIVLLKTIDGKKVRETVNLIKVFLNTFPPYQVEVNHENKTVNYKKG